MKGICMYGSHTGLSDELRQITNSVIKTFSELGVQIIEMNLYNYNLPYYDGGEPIEAVSAIMDNIKNSDALIIASPTVFFSPSAVVHSFFEYFAHPGFKDALRDKLCLIITTADTVGERECAEYISKAIGLCGGFEGARIAVGGKSLEEYRKNPESADIDKFVEDYYRIMRQKRKFFHGSDYYLNADYNIAGDRAVSNLPANTESNISDALGAFFNGEAEKEDSAGKIFDSFNEKQQEDIDELTKLFSSKLNVSETRKEPLETQAVYQKPKIVSEAVPRNKTCKQMTKSLIHFFQPQLSQDTNATIQINISGKETFECYLTIIGAENEFYEGIAETPDITIIASDNVWSDVLKGKYTAQKAFMTGQLKVRGNFMLLNKFDQLYKKEQ